MNAASAIRLILLSAIWGASFLFMRMGVLVLGPATLIFLRVALAAIFLFVMGAFLKKELDLRKHWRHYLILGFFNSALPFLLFAFAAKTLSASLLSILNATAPIWGAALGAVCARTPLARKPLIGLLLGIIGVSFIAGIETVSLPVGGSVAILAALGAACSYGIATTYAKSSKPVEPFANAHGSMWAAVILTAPVLGVSSAPVAFPEAGVIGAVIALGVLCSGVAYPLYFRLIADIGAAQALTVTFLIPVFGVLWGYLFLGEAVGWHMLAGAAIVLAGTALATGFTLTSFLRKPLRSMPP